MRAVDFYTKHVAPAVAEWQSNVLDERLAMNAAVALNQMADHYYRSFTAGDGRLFGASSPNTLRKVLAKQEPSFALLRDVAEAHKHVTLNRDDRQVTSADQTTVGTMGWGEAEFGYGQFGSPPELVVFLDSNEKRHFSALVDRTVIMWETLLKEFAEP